MKKYALLLLIPFFAFASSETLESELGSLSVPETLPANVTKEKLYSTQSRVLPLKRKVEVLVMASEGVSGNDFLKRNQLGGEVQYHINDRWALGAAYSQVYNKFTSSAEKLMSTEGRIPNVDYAQSRLEGKAIFNLFYGKIRMSRDQVIYLDQYLAGGWAQNQLASGASSGPLLDVGLAAWISTWGSVHLGLRDYYYEERGLMASGSNHNVDGYFQTGVLF